MKRGSRVLVALGLAALVAGFQAVTGCAHRAVNQPIATFDPHAGYRFGNTPPQANNSDEIFVILAFSGGGTRAAAFAYGAMEKLAAVTVPWQGRSRRLLDEVDIISSVSGGSFTAAYYGLYHDRLFTDFPDRFLYRDVTGELVRGLLNPLHWASFATAHYDRIDMAADLYDRQLFDHKTFADLAAVHARPFIVLNATDMSYVSRFEFTQDQFDLLGSDLSTLPIACGVAASSAFPILLSPLTLRTYAQAADYRAPGWIGDALSDRQAAPREYAIAQVEQSYLDHQKRPFIHLLDGGLADNIGLRGPASAITSVQGLWSLKQLLNTKIKYLVVIAVNAKTGGEDRADLKESSPGVSKVLSTVANGPMGNYSDETVQYLRDTVEGWRQDIANSREMARLRGKPVPVLHEIKFYAMELTFGDMPDAKERAYLNSLPTSFSLSREGVDHVRAAAGQLIDNSPEIKRLLDDLKNDHAIP